MEDMIQEIADLLSETKKAHHHAYIDVDGSDPEWPIWYADYLEDRLLPLLEASMTKSELIYALVHLSKVQPAEAPNADWTQYYAQYLVENYT